MSAVEDEHTTDRISSTLLGLLWKVEALAVDSASDEFLARELLPRNTVDQKHNYMTLNLELDTRDATHAARRTNSIDPCHAILWPVDAPSRPIPPTPADAPRHK